MRKSALHVVRTEPAPDTEVDTHGPRREYVTEDEVERLIRAASKHERGDRDALMILMAYRHGLRVSELVALQWAQIDLDAGRLRVRRLKGSDDSVHPLGGREIRALRKLRRGQPVGSPVRLRDQSRRPDDAERLLQDPRKGRPGGRNARHSPAPATARHGLQAGQ